MPSPALRQADLFEEPPNASDVWSDRLLAAFADANVRSGLLPLAEKAIAACPADAVLLLMAATAALLDERPERALVFLNRFSKRAKAPAAHLLHALALNQLNKRTAAKVLLEQHGLTSWPAALPVFPGGYERLPWLIRQLEDIMGRPTPVPGRRPAEPAKPI